MTADCGRTLTSDDGYTEDEPVEMDTERAPGARILVVEDDEHIRELVELHLGLEGHSAAAVADGTEALAIARAEPFDLLILDVMLPGLDGVTLCRAIRRDSRNADAPILMLTARREESDKVLGLDSGADDYLTKPFGIRELVARVRALLRRRRSAAGPHAPAVTAGALTIEPARRQARVDNREIELTAHEFDLLYLLATNRGIVFTRESLVQRVWGDDLHVTERSVDSLVKRVRRKIEADQANPKFIVTVWGRLRSLGEATKAIGEGRTEVRASEAGGDEVTALAQAFNKMASDLETRASALAASDEARRQLLADVSHELMTPLTAIRGYVQTLAMPHATADESARERYLNIIDQETYKLETIIGDLLDLARLEGGGGELILEKVPVTELFRRVLDRHGRDIHDRGLSIVTAVTPDDLHVRGDAARLEQVLQNIAANAIRHTPGGGRIELTAEHREDIVRITVRDTGSGIPEEHLPHVFDRFYKADRSRTHVSPAAGDPSSRATTPGGSGLGLSIVRAIVLRHGGTVSAHNVPEGGALFEILLQKG